MRWTQRLLVGLCLIFAGCATPTVPDPGGSTAPATTTVPPTESISDTRFEPGIYYGTPSGEQGVFRLAWVNGTLPTLRFEGVGFDLVATTLISVDDGRTFLQTGAGGQTKTIQLKGLYHPARPSVSPDGRHAVVQAADHADLSGGPGDDLDIYLVDVRDGTTTPISDEPVNEESPEWIPQTDQVLWSSFDPDAGIDAVVYNVTTKQVVRRFPGAGGIHLDVSNDANAFFDPARMRIYDLQTGALEADLHASTLAGLRAAGYETDQRYPGQANRGTFPMDGAFSPDGTRLVFDGAVRKDGQYGVIIASTDRDGTGFQVLTPLITVDPSHANHHSFSQLNPTWI